MTAPNIETRVRVGLCGFTMAMEDYARYFPVVEIQHTFYDPPDGNVMRRWLAVTPSSLEYTIKVWQLVTHAITSPTYRRMKRRPDPATEPGFFRASAAVAEGWQRSVRCAVEQGKRAVEVGLSRSVGTEDNRHGSQLEPQLSNRAVSGDGELTHPH